jgi:glycosyltransferase involved in cell wall biosynthesis
MLLTVAICAHNPRPDYLARTIAGLCAQSLPLSQWELLLIDNASTTDSAAKADLSAHPRARLVPEPNIGLTAARRRAIAEAAGEILVFVDDDNVLSPDYFAHVLEISRTHSWLGAWGAGRIEPEFENLPAGWLPEYAFYLTLAVDTRDAWGNGYDFSYAPFGAGLCIRRPIAQRYAQILDEQPQRYSLDRKGTQLSSGGDTDMAWTACDLGLGVGRFVRLQMLHLIPAFRTTPEFLLRVTESGNYSSVWLKHFRGLPQTVENPSLFQRVARWRYERTLPALARQLRLVARRGHARALGEITSAPRPSSPA